MASVTKSCTAVTEGNVWGYGTISWTDLTNIIGSDNAYATALGGVAPLAGPYPMTPICTDFDFAIPTGSSIDKITVKIEAKTDGENTGIDWVGLMLNGSPNLMHASCRMYLDDIDPDGPLTAADQVCSINPVGEGDGDLWGATWTPAMINSVTFGCAFDAYVEEGKTLSVDNVQITIEYTEDNPVTNVCNSVACGKGASDMESEIVELINKATDGCAGIKIQPTTKSCEDLTDIVSCGQPYSLEELFKAALTDDGCGGTSLRVFVLQPARGGILQQ